jgi:ribosomal protein S18 acetylase RimI-like enzyme
MAPSTKCPNNRRCCSALRDGSGNAQLHVGSPVIHAFELFDRAHPREVPHFYLSLLGTRAEHRGRGYGLGLLAGNLRRIDEAGMPAYLEASNPANVALYERHGFEVRGSFKLPGDGPEVFTMWRDAASLG